MRRPPACHGLAHARSRCLVDDALYLAAVDAEFAGDGALAVASLVPCCEPGGRSDPVETALDVVRIKRCSDLRDEHETVALSSFHMPTRPAIP